MSQPSKILIRAPQWLGDAVVSTYFLARLKRRYPSASLVVAAPDYLRDLYESHPAVSQFVGLPKTKSLVASVGLIRGVHADQIYILPRSFRTALEARLAQIPHRIGFAGDLRRFLLTDVHAYDAQLYYPHRYLKLLGEERLHLGAQRPYFPASASPFINIPKPALGLGPASIAPSRTWPFENYLAVAKEHLSSTQGSVVVFGSEREAALGNQLQESLGERVINTAGKLSLPQLGGTLSQCSAFVCNDSGLMHVASAFDVPTVVVFGASDPTYALPRVGRMSFLQKKDLDCVPCLKNHCVRLGEMHLACLKGVPVSEVMDVLPKN